MIKLIDFILDLFRDEDHAQAFVTNPDQALADAGSSNVTRHNCSRWPRPRCRAWPWAAHQPGSGL